MVTTGIGEVRRLGRYRLDATLGRGRLGTVYRAFDPRLRRELAIKTVPVAAAPAGTTRAAEHLLLEARTIASLNHPNIVTVYDVGEQPGVVYVAMELVDGEPLDSRLRRGPPLRFIDTARIVAQLADALAAAHERGIVHRDLKPANILLVDGRTPKLIDFGFAYLPAGVRRLSGMLVGTPRYMAPEQIEGRVADARTDVFGLGAVMYEMLCGVPASGGETLAEISEHLRRCGPTAPRELVPNVPRYLERVVLRMLAADPAARYPGARAVAERLFRYVRKAEATALLRRRTARGDERPITQDGLVPPPAVDRDAGSPRPPCAMPPPLAAAPAFSVFVWPRAWAWLVPACVLLAAGWWVTR